MELVVRTKHVRKLSLAFAAFAMICTGAVMAEGVNLAAAWPSWRGPQGTSAVAEGATPIEFGIDDGLAWKVDLPGLGASTPVVWGDSILLTAAVDGQNTVLCYGLDGKERWRKDVGKERAAKSRDASGANSSAVTDGKCVAAYFKSGDLAAFDLAGKELWRKNLEEQFGEGKLWWDLGTSPVLADGKVIVAVMQEGGSYLAAFDELTGDVAWKTDRTYKRPPESDQAYTTPQPVTVDGKTLIVTWGADHLTAHAADSGKLVWECGGFNPQDAGMWRVIASAPAADGMAVVPYGRGKFLAAVKLTGAGDVTASNLVWRKEDLGADVPTPALAEGKIYLLGDQGKLSCLDLATGEEAWSFDLPRSRHKFFASPLLVGDTIYCARIDGAVFVGKVTAGGFEQLAENALEDHIVATPVPVPGGVLFRGNERLVMAVGEGEGAAK